MARARFGSTRILAVLAGTILTVVALWVLAAIADFGPAPSAWALAATAWQATSGAQSGDKAIQALAFLPNELTVDIGDSITWSIPTAEIHTVTLLGVQPRPTQFQTACVTVNPVTYLGSSVTTYPRAGGGTCAYVNSGTLVSGQTYTVTFGTAGDFAFVCLVHAKMTGTVHVRAAGSSYPHDQGFYDQLGQQQRQGLLTQGEQMRAQEMGAAVAGRNKNQVAIGQGFVTSTSGGFQSVSINRFLPGSLTIPLGTTVTWTALDPATPHTFTLGAEPANPRPPTGLTGPGVSTTLNAPYPQLMVGPTVNSGFLGVGQPSGTTFRATFNVAGIYQYYCALHDELGMLGIIRVIPPGTPS